jgi:hypothetical protein
VFSDELAAPDSKRLSCWSEAPNARPAYSRPWPELQARWKDRKISDASGSVNQKAPGAADPP